MVRDAYSAGGQQTARSADDNTQDQSLDLRGNAASLTQELAQLLAASIAQGQASRRVGTPTGAELASLAALVSAAQNQRGLSTGFKDGLSSLSYTPPQAYAPPPPQAYAPAPAYAPVAPQAPVTGGAVQLTEQHDDEPMPIPSTWRQPAVSDDDRWYRQQMGAAALGLVAGLMVVVPAVLWLSGWFGGPTRAAATSRQPVASYTAPETVTAPPSVKVRPADKAEVASQYVAATLEPRRSPDKAPPAAEAPAPAASVAPGPVVAVQPPPAPKADPVRSRVEDLLAQAERMIEGGDILGARGMLAGNEGMGQVAAPLVFALAETYDPNMLAAWGTRGVTADVMKARSLYVKARDLGVTRAQLRLDQLR